MTGVQTCALPICFVAGTLLMRLSLSAPPLLCSATAVFAAFFVLGLNFGANYFAPQAED